MWQKRFDMDAIGDYHYDVSILDGLQDKNEIDFAIFEDITDHDVLIKRRGKVVRMLKTGTPFIIMSNRVQVSFSEINLLFSQLDVW